MRKIKMKFILLTLIITVIFNCTGIVAYATPTNSIGYCTVNVEITVPTNFEENIILYFNDPLGKTNYSFLLTKGDQYKGTYGLEKGTVYTVDFKFDSKDKDQITGIEDGYDTIENDKLDCKFTIEPYKGKTNSSSSGTTKDTEVTKSTNNINYDTASADDILKSFEEKISDMKNNSAYDSFLSIYKGDMFKNYYFDNTIGKSESDWTNLSGFDSFKYYIAYIYPKTCIMGENAVKTQSLYMDKLKSTKSLLSSKPNGDKMYQAIEEVWLYLWKDWEKTGQFVNIFENEKLDIEAQATGDEEIFTEQEKKDIKNELEKEEGNTKGNIILEMLKNNIISIVILFICGIAMIVLYIKNKKKNIDTKNDEE